MSSPILAPAAVLILWSLVVLYWVIGTRFPAFKAAGIELGGKPPGGRYQDIESAMPERVNWKSHNYTHLMEQPTLFYAVVMVLALTGEGAGINLMLAWGYVGLRVIHSIWQSMFNTVPVRVSLFAMSTLCLTALAVNAVVATI